MNRRGFLSCTLCAAGGLTATAAETPPPASITRTVLQRTEFPGDKMVSVLISAEVPPNSVVARHTHPGLESGYLTVGGGMLSIKGQPDRAMKAGDSYQVPPDTPHMFRNDGEKTVIVGMFVVEKDKPLATPAPE